MNITEKKCCKNVKISKVNFTVDDADNSIPDPLPKKSFFYIISGRPNSGKSTQLINLLTKRNKMFNGKFDRVYIFSPSLNSIKNDPFKSIPPEQKFEDLTLDNLKNCIDDISDSGEKVLFVLDDCVSDMSNNAELNVYLMKCLFNRRHLCGGGGSASFIITTQGFIKIKPELRKTATHLALYHTRNLKEIDTIYSEMIMIKKHEFYNILNYIFDKPHNFLYLDLDKPLNKMFYKNFNQLSFDIEGGDQF